MKRRRRTTLDVRETDLLLNHTARSHRDPKLEKEEEANSPDTLAQLRPWKATGLGSSYQSSPHVAFVQHIGLNRLSTWRMIDQAGQGICR